MAEHADPVWVTDPLVDPPISQRTCQVDLEVYTALRDLYMALWLNADAVRSLDEVGSQSYCKAQNALRAAGLHPGMLA